jgi:allantoinase
MKLIRNAIICDGANDTKKVQILFDETILEISEHEIPVNSKVKILDLEGKLLIPGCIDTRVHLDNDGEANESLIPIATRLAAKGGITTVIEDVVNTNEPITEKEQLEDRKMKYSGKSYIDHAFWGVIRMNDYPLYTDLAQQLWNAGTVGFRINLFSLNDDVDSLSYQDILNLFSALADTNILFSFDPEDVDTIQSLLPVWQKCMFNPAEGYFCMSEIQSQAVRKITRRSQENPIHFFGINTQPASEFILNSLKKYNLSFDVFPLYMEYPKTPESGKKIDCPIYPPIQTDVDKDFLRTIIKSGKLFVLSSQSGHINQDGLASCFPELKDKVHTDWLEYMVPYLFSEFYIKDKTTLDRMIKLTSENAAKRFGLYPRKGCIEVNSDADFTVIDLNAPPQKSKSPLPCSPTDLACSVTHTFLRGNLIYEVGKGILSKKNDGVWIPRSDIQK